LDFGSPAHRNRAVYNEPPPSPPRDEAPPEQPQRPQGHVPDPDDRRLPGPPFDTQSIFSFVLTTYEPPKLEARNMAHHVAKELFNRDRDAQTFSKMITNSGLTIQSKKSLEETLRR
jgi:hypothetical protein